MTAGDQNLGTGDGVRVAFPLMKAYRSGDEIYRRPVAKPVRGTVLVAVAGQPLVESIDWVVDDTTGIVTFVQAPDLGTVVTAGFEFDVPVRFDTDRIVTSVASFKAGEVPQVPVVELRA